jgi:hypothetical protein
MDNPNELLIHTVKTIRYRFIRATQGASASFGEFRIGAGTRQPKEIVNHMFDLVTKTISMLLHGHFSTPQPAQLIFEEEKERFLAALNELQTCLSRIQLEPAQSKKLLQGPLLDMVTHIGQLAMLNGLHGNKVPRESYFDARLED